jgi:hypothetical protein
MHVKVIPSTRESMDGADGLLTKLRSTAGALVGVEAVGRRIENSGAAWVWWLGARALGMEAVAKGPDEGKAARVFGFYRQRRHHRWKGRIQARIELLQKKGKCRVHEMKDTGGGIKEREG